MQMLRVTSLALFLVAGCTYSSDIPQLEGRVNDYAGVLSVQERADLESTLAKYQDETTHQVAVLTVSSLHGETIEEFSLRVANAWKLGRKGLDNGVLITLAPNEREARIELGRGINRFVSDSTAKAILSETMIPAFRAGHFSEGLRLGVDRLLKECRAYQANAEAGSSGV